MDKRILIVIVIIAALGAVAGGFFIYRNWGEKTPLGNVSRNEGGRKYFSEVTIEAKPFFFAPDVVEVKTDKEATFNVRSSGNHSFIIDELGINISIPDGKTETIKFTPTSKGMFKFYCSVPGHREAGMEGTLVVN